MTIDLEWAIGINRISLKILGLWPDDKLTRRQSFLANARAFFIFILMMLAAIVPQMLAMFHVWGDIMAFTDNLQISVPFSVTVMKFAIMWLRKEGKFTWTPRKRSNVISSDESKIASTDNSRIYLCETSEVRFEAKFMEIYS